MAYETTLVGARVCALKRHPRRYIFATSSWGEAPPADHLQTIKVKNVLTSLFVSKDQVDPLVQLARHKLRLQRLNIRIQV